jgi:hypothetical protein
MRGREAVVNLPAQAVDVHVYEVRERVEVLVPDVLGYLGAREHAAALAREVFEQRVLLGRQLDLPARARDDVRARVYRRSAAVTSAGRTARPRRSRARRRASSSATSKGFVR